MDLREQECTYAPATLVVATKQEKCTALKKGMLFETNLNLQLNSITSDGTWHGTYNSPLTVAIIRNAHDCHIEVAVALTMLCH